MHIALVLLVAATLTLLDSRVEADFWYNQPTPNAEQIKARGLKCIPGRTVIEIGQVKADDQDESDEARRTHTNTKTNDESCKICVCSTEGKDVYCSKRPARNVNECIRLSLLKKRLQSSMPFEHERSLSFRIRRDYIWHNDEIPYEAKASCKRSTSYYSNSINANNTDIDVASDIDSLLDYADKDICYFCVCSVDGRHAGCISRAPWFCEYYRVLRAPGAAKERYHKLFQQDRPAYFRQISYRLRRTMDDGLVTFYDAVGEDNINDTKCIPFVSEYSDCTEANYCSGCNRCKCNASAQWECKEVLMCPGSEEEDPDRDTIVTNIDNIQKYIELKNKEKKPRTLVPPPLNDKDDLIEENPYEEKFETWFSRQKRSLKEDSAERSIENATVNFFHTVDEINEDTLKDFNKTGTIEAHKVAANRIPKISRRTDVTDNINRSAQSSLHIEYNQPQDYDNHIAENKIDASHVMSKLDEKELQKLIGNYSHGTKDKDLSKLVVNELKAGDEIIGDKNVTPTSNITFTPENDTLTAMAFIAGNLLSKLWDMEKDVGDDSIETEVLKHEKINDLLELFKEPLSLRQETFLKNALEKLSDTLNKNKSMRNVSICETITGSDLSQTSDESGHKDDLGGVKSNKTKCKQHEHINKPSEKENKHNVTLGVVSKLNNVLGLIKEFEGVHKNLKDMKHQISSEHMHAKDSVDIDNKPSFELFGTLLDKITKLLTPNKNKAKRITNKLKKLYQFTNKSNVNNIYETKLNIDFGQINMTTKDKLILDYLNHIQSNPECLFRNNTQKNSDNFNVDIKGNILYKLSEFMKMQSFMDLAKITKHDSPKDNNSKLFTRTSNEVSSIKSLPINRIIDGEKQSSSTKDKLKLHLKAIVDDLQQLQKERGINNIKNINILDVLPCIYRVLYANKVLDEKSLDVSNKTHLDKIKSLIDMMKLEFQANLPTRRNYLTFRDVPKSAKIWERMIKNINSVQSKTRRSSVTEKPKTFEELKDIMEKVELMGSTYKNIAILSGVPIHKRLMLLKTLEADTKQQSIALENIKRSLDPLDEIALDRRNEFDEFIENVANSIRLSSKVLENVEKTKQFNISKKSEVELLLSNKNKHVLKSPKPLKMTKEIVEYKNKNIKLSRDQILNQLILNRVQLYVKSKESSGADLTDDINYNIGKRILFLIESGNLNVANELFKVFIVNKQNEEKLSPKRDSNNRQINRHPRKRTRPFLAPNEPLLRFNEPGRELQVLDNLYSQF